MTVDRGARHPSEAGEWLLANGLGGYALGPLGGPATRGYHGWLVAATRPPDGRVLLVGSIEASVILGGREHSLAAIAIAPGTATAAGVTVRLDSAMQPLANATVLSYARTDHGAAGEATLRLRPLVAGRDHHPGAAVDAPASVSLGDDGRRATITWSNGAPDLVIAVDAGAIALEPREVPVHYPEETARGTSPGEILHAPLVIEAALPPGGRIVIVLGTDAGSEAAVPHPDAAPAVIASAAAHAADLARTV